MHIMDNFEVKRFVAGSKFAAEPAYNRLLSTARTRRVPVEIWTQGDSFSFGNGMKSVVLNPSPKHSLENPNNRSLVFTIKYGSNSFLLTGDMESVIEEQLVLSNFDLRAEVLKIPHHGSKNSSAISFLRAVKPALAIMSVGPGIRGIPSKEALERYRMLHIPVLRTDRDGLIRVCSNGKKITYVTYQENDQ